MSILVNTVRDIFRSSRSGKNPGVAPADGPLRVFIGYDHRQAVAYNVLQYSLFRHSSRPVAITPLVLDALPIERLGLTPFTYSRFLVPWLCGYEGWGWFLDLDMLIRDDIAEVFEMADPSYAVMVTKNIARFEWASSILFNCAHPANRVLTPDYVDDAARCQAPHMFDWLDPELIGALPAEWNHTVGYDADNPNAKLIHYTQGVPCHPETRGCEYTDVWSRELEQVNATRGWPELMGTSVHAKRLDDGRVVPNLHDRIEAAHGEEGAERGDVRAGPVASPSARYESLIALYRQMHVAGDEIHSIPADQTFDGRSLYPHIDSIAELTRSFGAQTVLDYGCGKAGAYQGNLTTPDGREAGSVKDVWGVSEITLYDPGYERYSERPTGRFDGVVSTDVLEHCPEEDIGWIVDEMFGYAKSFLFCTISCRPAVKSLPTGENAHITVRPPQWWKTVLDAAARRHPEVRYFAVCFDEKNEPTLLEG